MAIRSVFYIKDEKVKEKRFDIVWHRGLSLSQKQKNIESLNNKIIEAYNTSLNYILEISTKSTQTVGKELSAINLKFKEKGYKNVFKELNLHKRGKHPEELGDYDILVFDEKNNIIWNIESKVIQLVGSISRFAKQQNTFFESHENDKKFQKRIDYLTENIDEISKDLNITLTSNITINNIMVTNKVFASEFKEVKFTILAYNELLEML